MVLLSSQGHNQATNSAIHIEWEEVDCLLCGGNRYNLLLEAADPAPAEKGLWFAVMRCEDCDLCFTNPRPNRNTIGQFYTENYPPHQQPTPRSQSRWLKRYPSLPRWLTHKHQAIPLQGQGRLLDFGCGAGLFLEQMRQRGWKVTGVDTSAVTVQRLRTERGLDTYAGSLPHPDLAPESFEVITMWHSLEHVHYPIQVLQAAWKLLVPGGKLIVAVPNIESLPFRWFGSAWYGLDLPRHLLHFGPGTLRGLLQLCGFEVEPIRMVRHSSWLRMSAKSAWQQRRSFRHRLIQAKSPSRLLSWYHYLTKQSDCILALAVKH